MSKIIAIAGKGGVGKTTVSSLVIKYLKEKSLIPILAVDADPSTNLNISLGMEVKETVGGIREKARFEREGISLPDYLELRINMALVEGEGIDLIAMGRTEGKGCYCPANANLRQILKRLSVSYKYIVIDNEAGLEHISRQTDDKVDILFIVSDQTRKGIMTAVRINNLVRELENEIRNNFLIINRASENIPFIISKLIEDEGLVLAGTIREDINIPAIELSGRSILDIKNDTVSFRDISNILEKATV